MKKTITTYFTLICSLLLLSLFTATSGFAQVIEIPGEDDERQLLPLTFNLDTEDIDWEGFTFFPFEGAALERIENPDKSGLNETDFVLQYIKADGQPWAGFFYTTDEVITITDESVFKLKVWSNTDEISIMLKFEMEEFADVASQEMLQPVETANEWVELEWDLSDVDSETPWDRVVIIADLEGPAGDGSDRFTWYLDDFSAESGEATSNELSDLEVPNQITLNQNYPNPFNPSTTIDFALPEASHVDLTVYNLLGQRVATLSDEFLSAGQHTVSFNASDLSSGIYMYRLQTENHSLTRSLTLVK